MFTLTYDFDVAVVGAGPAGAEAPHAPPRLGQSPQLLTKKADAGATHRIKTRYVTFGHGTDKFYRLLRAPAGSFAVEDAALEKLLARFRFGGAAKALSR